MIASTPTINTEIFTFITVLVFKLLNHKVLLINRKTIEPKILANFTGKSLQNYK